MIVVNWRKLGEFDDLHWDAVKRLSKCRGLLEICDLKYMGHREPLREQYRKRLIALYRQSKRLAAIAESLEVEVDWSL